MRGKTTSEDLMSKACEDKNDNIIVANEGISIYSFLFNVFNQKNIVLLVALTIQARSLK